MTSSPPAFGPTLGSLPIRPGRATSPTEPSSPLDSPPLAQRARPIPDRPILALDCGSTNFKAALFTPDLRRIAQASAPLPYLAEEPDRTELDPNRVWDCAKSVLVEALRLAGISPQQRPILSLTSQAQTFALFDGNSHVPLSPFLSWRDGRARSESDEIRRLEGERFPAETGFPDCIPHLLAPKLLWLLRQLATPPSTPVQLMTLPGFIACKWAGINAIDPNLAAMSGLFSIPSNSWNQSLLQYLNFRPDQLPELVPLGQPQSGTAGFAESGPQPEVVFAGNDQTAGAFGNDCSGDHLLVTLGTALVAYRIAGAQPGPYPGQGIWGPYPGGGFYELVTSNDGCSALDQACRRLAPGDPKALLRDADNWLAAHPHPASWNTALPSIKELCVVLEGITFELQRLITTHFPPLPPSAQLRVCGGGSQSDAWLQMIASVFNRPVIRASGDALLGAAHLVSSAPLPPLPQNSAFLPDPTCHLLYTRRFEFKEKP